jgi:5'-methylthioadenosine phosphorylase
MAKIGIIGGSGLDDPEIMTDVKKVKVTTPYGDPSSDIVTGVIGGQEVLLLARHGNKHQYSPTQVNYRANIDALKSQGASHILATSACGSLRKKIDRGDFVIIDQFIDFTKKRQNTFFESFEDGAKHTAMADPFDTALRKVLFDTATELNLKAHNGGTVVTIEGPRFSTRAESHMFRSWGGDVINMSVATEVALAAEAELPYAVVAMSTDYDCWKDDEAPVTWDEILEVFNNNVGNVVNLLTHAIPKIV